MSEQPDKPAPTLPFVIPVILVGMLVVPVEAILWVDADWVPLSITTRLHGAMESEVRELLVDPEHSGLHTWAFRAASPICRVPSPLFGRRMS